ncbi:MAG: GGDEF domain-containing protein [Burkholderiaceae bacterium]
MFDLRSFLLIGGLISLVCLGILAPMRAEHVRARAAVQWSIAGLLLLGVTFICVAILPPHRLEQLGSVLGARPYWPALGLGLASTFALHESLNQLADSRSWRLPMLATCVLIGLLPAFDAGLIDDLAGFTMLLSASQGVALLFVLDSVSTMLNRARAGWRISVIVTGMTLGVCLLALPAFQLPELILGTHVLPGWLRELVAMLGCAATAIIGQVSAMLLMSIVNGRVALEYRKLAAIDTLTGLRGRRAFFEDGARLLADQFQASRMTCLMMLDLDHFKHINDSYGHPAGDKALVMFSNMLRVAAPVHAIAGRYGGEEFCMLLPVESRRQAREIAHEFVLRTRGVVVDGDTGRIPLTVSIGCAVSPDDGVNLDDLVAAADRRVYIAKNNGRNRAESSDRKGDDGPTVKIAVAREPLRVAKKRRAVFIGRD